MTIPINANATNNFGVAQLIVDAIPGRGTHTTIANALATAVSGQTIFIRPGTYTENPALVAGVNLCAFDCDAYTPNVTINGQCTFSSAGTVSISGIRLQTNSATFLSVTGSAASIVNLENCYLNCSNNSGITFSSSSASANINILYCSGNLGTTGINLFANTSAGAMEIRYSKFTNTGSSTTASTSSSGVLNCFYSFFTFPFTTSSTSAGQFYWCDWDSSSLNTRVFTIGGSTIQSFEWCVFSSGSASAVSIGSSVATLIFCNIVSSNTNAITGLGTLTYGNLTFGGTSSGVNTSTQIPLVLSNDAIKVVSASGASYTTVPQDGLILVDGNVTATIVPLASPTTGQRHIIKDNAGTAAAHNITVTPSGKNIDGAASFVINTNFGSITIIFNATQWNIV